MGGWKTWVGGLGIIFSGLSLAMAGVVSDPMNFDHVMQGLALAGTGLAAIGIGHKIEKS
jgi:hypothetical protein